jgi:hypothetical protein
MRNREHSWSCSEIASMRFPAKQVKFQTTRVEQPSPCITIATKQKFQCISQR